MLSVTDFDSKGTISEVRVHGGANLDMLDAGRSPNADSPPRDHLITMVKLKKKTYKKVVSKNEKPEHPRWSVRKNDDYVMDYTCEDGCVKVENLKTAKTRLLKVRQGVFPSVCPQEHIACTDLLCRSGEGRGRLKIACEAPRPLA